MRPPILLRRIRRADLERSQWSVQAVIHSLRDQGILGADESWRGEFEDGTGDFLIFRKEEGDGQTESRAA